MADNGHKYGFRWAQGQGTCPAPVYKTIATSIDHQDDGSNSVGIRPGDPVKLVSTGAVTIALTDQPVWGIVTVIAPYWDGTKMVKGNMMPNQNAWGTVEARRPYVGVVPAKAGMWEIDCDDNTTATTLAAYVALIGENANHDVPGNTTDGTADPFLRIAGAATDDQLGWRIEGVSKTLENKDFSGLYVKLLVNVNDSQEAGAVDGATNAQIVPGI
jgi:hypothetical protein